MSDRTGVHGGRNKKTKPEPKKTESDEKKAPKGGKK